MNCVSSPGDFQLGVVMTAKVERCFHRPEYIEFSEGVRWASASALNAMCRQYIVELAEGKVNKKRRVSRFQAEFRSVVPPANLFAISEQSYRQLELFLTIVALEVD